MPTIKAKPKLLENLKTIHPFKFNSRLLKSFNQNSFLLQFHTLFSHKIVYIPNQYTLKLKQHSNAKNPQKPTFYNKNVQKVRTKAYYKNRDRHKIAHGVKS